MTNPHTIDKLWLFVLNICEFHYDLRSTGIMNNAILCSGTNGTLHPFSPYCSLLMWSAVSKTIRSIRLQIGKGWCNSCSALLSGSKLQPCTNKCKYVSQAMSEINRKGISGPQKCQLTTPHFATEPPPQKKRFYCSNIQHCGWQTPIFGRGVGSWHITPLARFWYMFYVPPSVSTSYVHQFIVLFIKLRLPCLKEVNLLIDSFQTPMDFLATGNSDWSISRTQP